VGEVWVAVANTFYVLVVDVIEGLLPVFDLMICLLLADACIIDTLCEILFWWRHLCCTRFIFVIHLHLFGCMFTFKLNVAFFRVEMCGK